MTNTVVLYSPIENMLYNNPSIILFMALTLVVAIVIAIITTAVMDKIKRHYNIKTVLGIPIRKFTSGLVVTMIVFGVIWCIGVLSVYS